MIDLVLGNDQQYTTATLIGEDNGGSMRKGDARLWNLWGDFWLIFELTLIVGSAGLLDLDVIAGWS